MKKALMALSIAALSIAPVLVAHAADLDHINSYTITRAARPLTIDGKLDESSWKEAREATLVDTRTGEPVRLKSTVRLLWDDTYLYVGFYCEDPDAWATLTEYDDPLWGEEVVEVFIDPEGEGHTYYELEFSPINNIVDLFVVNAGKAQGDRYRGVVNEWSFTDNLKSAVHVEGDGKNEGTKDTYWTTEIAIPFDELWTAKNRPPLDGEMWRIGLYRIERGDSKDRDDDFYAAFNPTIKGSFHTPWRFGIFYFQK